MLKGSTPQPVRQEEVLVLGVELPTDVSAIVGLLWFLP